ncbi:hypothetical protein CsSME_00008112 [Camellia sinensis var. sinensis]
MAARRAVSHATTFTYTGHKPTHTSMYQSPVPCRKSHHNIKMKQCMFTGKMGDIRQCPHGEEAI